LEEGSEEKLESGVKGGRGEKEGEGEKKVTLLENRIKELERE
jgi:hypothetical protein